jgi:hypothetical protein
VFEELMRETDDIATKRKACQDMRDLMLSLLEVVNQVNWEGYVLRTARYHIVLPSSALFCTALRCE